MHDVVLLQVGECLKDVRDDLGSLLAVEGGFFLNEVLEGAAREKFSY